MEILSEEQKLDFNKIQQEKTVQKFKRVADYLGSEKLRSSINNYNESFNQVSHNDKITNSYLVTEAKNTLLEPRKYAKTFKFLIDVSSNKVSYA